MNKKELSPPVKEYSTKSTLFFISKNSFLKIFSFAQNRFQFFDVDISTFVAPEKPLKMSKNAIHV